MSSFSSLNKVMLLGRLGKDPEKKYANSGTAIVNFSLATSESVKKDEQWEDKTEWHKIVMFGKLAENTAKFCKKGSQVFLEGRIQTRSYQDKQGNDKYITEVVASVAKFLDTKDGMSKETSKPMSSKPASPVVDLEDDDEDLPF